MKAALPFFCASLGIAIGLAPVPAPSEDLVTLPGTQPLTVSGDLSARMVDGIHSFLSSEIEHSLERRAAFWNRDFSSRPAYEKSVAPNREQFRRMIGAVDARAPIPALEYVSSTAEPALVAETDAYRVLAVRWPVFAGVWGEGLLLQPKGAPQACVIAVPDADQTPEMITGLSGGLPAQAQFGRRLAENGCQVLALTLVDRKDTWSGNDQIRRFTNLPHREWIYRQAFELGRHVIGYEVQKVLAAVDWFEAEATRSKGPNKIGVIGYAEGGLIAFYAAALDPRIDAAVVSGYFDSRQRVWEEPIYRNVFQLLRGFGDAEIASLVAPRPLIIEHSDAPTIAGPPQPHDGRSGAASGRWQTPDFNTVDAEAERARELVKPLGNSLVLLHGNEGSTVGPCGDYALSELLKRLGVASSSLKPPGPAPADRRGVQFSAAERQKRQVAELVDHTQRLLRASERKRDESFWRGLKNPAAAEWSAAAKAYQSNLWDNVIGRFPPASLPAQPRSRKIYDRDKWTGYEVMLDVWPEVYAWGVLLLPKDLKPGERRPVVVCQHGLEGVPADTINEDPKAGGYGAYRGFSARLAERGFVVFAPHNPYRGVDKFRTLQRKANPLGRSLFSVILAQHERILDWLSEQPFVDPKRIGFYGLSYGGKTAMRVPSLLDRYCLSICSADFNEWATKCATVDSGYSYLYTIEYDMYEFDLAHTFNYAEMAALIAPRPFMVERGHNDGVAPDEWVAHEYARVRRFYAKLGIPERTEIEFFNGPHTINGQGTFRFLHRHLNWPEP
jgi:dienelactone hydrolase